MACPHQSTSRLPGNPRIVCANNSKPADVDPFVDSHVVWKVWFNGVSAYSEDLVLPNVTIYQFASS